EMRAVNNRYLKVTLRAPEPYLQLEPEVEKVVRRTVKRGTVTVQLRCSRPSAAADFALDPVALRSYLSQAQAVAKELGLPGGELYAGVLALPGVVPEAQGAGLETEEEWPLLESVLEQATARLQQSRQKEGVAMAAQLLALRDHIAGQLTLIRARAPQVGEQFRGRLLERVRLVLSELDVQIDRKELIKEVAVFAERADVSEEITRLDSHLAQFSEVIEEPESAGRKLDFITQEMFRETNTIGSKASDVDISRHVVEIKGTLEKIRELVQNVE
ncbi:MAG: YicC family protein, partial [Gemmataceae bacterium]|nr:YicC family protein [Gemmataceae bacterium]